MIYAETTLSLPRREQERQLLVRASGAFSITEGGQTSRGCIARDELEGLEAALSQASFQPPPPPEMTCMAMPTKRTVYEDRRRGRRAAIETPCGKQPLNPDVSDVSRVAGALVADASDDHDPDEVVETRPGECRQRGAQLASASTAPLRRARGAQRQAIRVRVATDGSWVREEGTAVTCGQLPSRELRRLRAEVRRAELGTIDQPIQCRALPSTEHRVSTRADRASWQTPCGAATPTDATRELTEAILSIGA